MAMTPVALAQSKFLMNGGGYELPMAQMRERGLIPEAGAHPYKEYPKALRISLGMGEPTVRRTDSCKGTEIVWTEPPHEMFETIIVHSEEEEERFHATGRTAVQFEEERQGLINRCHSLSIPVDPGWTVVRLRRELGDALDAPAPGNEMAKLEAELAALQRMQAMRAEIASLRAQIAEPEQIEAPIGEPIEELGDTARRRKSA